MKKKIFGILATILVVMCTVDSADLDLYNE